MRRRGEPLAEVGGAPEWLRAFKPAQWSRKAEPPPEGWAFGVARWREVRGHQLWREAGLSWLDDRGQRSAWWSLTRPRGAVR